MPQVKKLSVATVYGKIDLKALFNSDAPIHVMRVYGQAVQTKTGESSYGEWTSLLGQFRALNPATGESFDGATLFLPDVALIPVQVALSQGATSFAIDLFVKQSANTKPGGSPYEYSFSHVLPPTDDDPIKRLEVQMEAMKALPAPTEPAPSKGGKMPKKGTAKQGAGALAETETQP
jgi:hypothetical protein